MTIKKIVVKQDVTKPAAAATKATVKPASPKPAAPKQAVIAKPASAIAAEKTVAELPIDEKKKKLKLVRDSFAMPKAEYDQIQLVKERCLTKGVAAKKSEILRVALAKLAQLSDDAISKAIKGLPPIKTGRPAKVSD